ncbi:MAG: hypothetical protein KJ630_04080 [Proteobacteria bacterium]|nr:hypothetical protein [Pseudomonadota bacterium]
MGFLIGAGGVEMMKGIDRFKPAVRKNTLLLSSACLWTVIGLLLLVKGGYRWYQLPDHPLLIIALGIFFGSVKSLWLLDKTARRGVERILNFADGTCLGAVYSSKTWLLVLCMMGLGVILRNSSFPVQLLCFLYLTIGWALLFSSRFAWREWLKR